MAKQDKISTLKFVPRDKATVLTATPAIERAFDAWLKDAADIYLERMEKLGFKTPSELFDYYDQMLDKKIREAAGSATSITELPAEGSNQTSPRRRNKPKAAS